MTPAEIIAAFDALTDEADRDKVRRHVRPNVGRPPTANGGIGPKREANALTWLAFEILTNPRGFIRMDQDNARWVALEAGGGDASVLGGQIKRPGGGGNVRALAHKFAKDPDRLGNLISRIISKIPD